MIKVYSNEFLRYIKSSKGELIGFEGIAFFETKDLCRQAARIVRRRYKIPVRSTTIPRSHGLQGYDERYLLMVSTNHIWPDELIPFILSQKGCLE